MSRKPLIAANWKMYKTTAEARACAEALLPLCLGHTRDEVVICPPFFSLAIVLDTLSGSGIAVGAQNMHFAEEGAFTGEISAPMLTSMGVTHVIIGHSERRQYFCETDETVNQKLHAALHHGLTPIVCVGEVLAEREEGLTEEVLIRQVAKALLNISPQRATPIVIAYEPVWAIGTGKTATPELGDAGPLHHPQRSGAPPRPRDRRQHAHPLRRQRPPRQRLGATQSARDRWSSRRRRQPESRNPSRNS